MDDGPTASMTLLFFALLLIDIFFYGFQAALEGLSEKEIEKRAQEEKDKKSIRLQGMLQSPAAFWQTFQMVATLANVTIGVAYLSVLIRFFSDRFALFAAERFEASEGMLHVTTAAAVALSIVLLLYITLTLGILLPRQAALRAPERWAYACVTPVYITVKLFSPFTGLSSLTARGILRLFGIRADEGEADVTEEEIINIINEGHEQGVIQASEAQMISNIFAFGDKEVQDIMTHRNSIVAIDAGLSLKEAIDLMLSGTNSRYPVYEENIDHIIGILHLKDAMRFQRDEENTDRPLRETEGLLREAWFVPQTKNIDELFREMQAQKQQMAVVVDEYGQTDGLVAMEDILEEIVGNILDEYDTDSDSLQEEKGKDQYVLEGKNRLEELEGLLDVSFADEQCETLNGFLISRLDRIPEPDEQFDVDYGGYNFKILSVENKMIQRVLVTRLPSQEETGEQGRAGGETVLEETPQK